MKWLVVLALIACGSPRRAPETTPRVLAYTVLAAERRAGHGEVRIEADGTRRTHFEYNDRGRGPRVDTELRVDERGAPRYFRATGNSYMKAPIHERLDERKGALVWESSVEYGSGTGFYLIAYGDLDTSLVRALLRAPDRRLKLLPAGEAWIEEDNVHVVGGKRLHQVAITGLDLGPRLIWLDDEHELFAYPSSYLAIVRTGSEALVPKLIELDQAWHAKRSTTYAAKLAKQPPAIAFVGVRMFDSEKRTVVDNATVVVRGDKIAAVGDATVAVPAGATVIAGRGRMLIPGLWDMHVHLGDSTEGAMLLANGITTVRDVGNDIDELAARVARYDAGTELGPTVLMAGFIDGPGELASPTKVLVSTPEEARAAVDRYAERGCVQIKIYSSVKPELVPVIAARAKERGMRVSGHVPMGMTAASAIDAGFEELQHINFAFLDFVADPTDDTRTPLRFTRVAERAGTLALDSAPVRAFVDKLVAKRIALDPTLQIFEWMFKVPPGELAPAYEPWVKRMPATVLRVMREGGLTPTGEKRAIYAASFTALQRFVKLAYDRGIPIVAGTDAGSLSLARELELYVQAGIPAREVLALASLGAARVMGKDREVGSISVGKRADLVLLDGDPTKSIGDVRNTEVVVARGKLYMPDEIFRSLGISQRTHD